MQQAARVSQRTAFFHLGKLIEEGETSIIFTNPKKGKRTLDYITGRFGCLPIARHRRIEDRDRTYLKAFDADLEDLRRHISEMGGIAEKMLADSITSLVRRDTPWPRA